VQPTALEETVLGTVADFVRGTSITFRNAKTEEELPIDFRGTETRFHSTEKIDGVRAFATAWGEEQPIVFCVFTELRGFGKPN
jgi:hypothetical protein